MNKYIRYWFAPIFVVVSILVPTLSVAGQTGHPAFLSPHAAPIVVLGSRVFVTNTPADTVDVIDASSGGIVARIRVGIDPISVAVRPDGREIWVANHVSDSVSVIDTHATSPTYLQIIATVQDFHPISKATRFDEPVGIAFADNNKAYVALSSENQIAVINVATRQVDKHLVISAQDPRAIAVHGNRLYVIPFESNNQTQLSGCVGALGSSLCTFDIFQHSVRTNNVLSRGVEVDIVKNPAVPDRDLYVFDTNTDQLVQTVNTLGTLLYGMAVDSTGRVFITQTDARNDSNGRAGTRGDGLEQMDNRAFLNRLTRVDCSGQSCQQREFIDLEPLPPTHPAPGMALATPYAIAISKDDATLVVTAAGSNKLFTLDAATGAVLGRVTVDAVPRGIALESDESGALLRAWVLNAAANTVSVVDVSQPSQPEVLYTVTLEDPTHPAVKRGRIAFNDATASTTGTFSCESCHPDGGTDQLLWVLNTPPCNLPGCDQIPPRATMPIRGLRDTAPYHWDGIPGDPYGGNNTANIFGSNAANCTADRPESCTRHLIDGGLANTMCEASICPLNDEGKGGALTASQRDDMATFLLSVPYPPAQRRAYTNVLSSTAANGFRLFHIDGDLQGGPSPNVCGDCHRMPFWVSTNTPGTGMEAPTWRGAYDRWLILPQGRLNVIDLDFYRSIAELGAPEQSVWRLSWGGRTRFDPVWNMVTEGSTGFSGTFARQVTLNSTTAGTASTAALLDAMELSASEGGIVLVGEGVLLGGSSATPVSLQFERGRYVQDADGASLTRAQLLTDAAQGSFVGTFTARLGADVDVDYPQPALWSEGRIAVQRGPQRFPVLVGENTTLTIGGRHIQTGAHVIVDGRRVSGNVRCRDGTLPHCDYEGIEVQLATLPPTTGMHFLQIQNRDGLFSNDYIFHTRATGITPDFDVSGPWFNANQDGHGWFIEKVAGNSPEQTEQLNVYWYVYADGQPVWLIGVGDLVNGRANIETYITSGGTFPPSFTPDAVNLARWGTMSFEFADDQTGSVSWTSSVAGFGNGSLNIAKIAAIADSTSACHSGSYYHPNQNGHGFVAQVVESNGENQLLLAWYVYLDGQQIWLLGQAPLRDQQAEIAMQAYAGGNFPPAFSGLDVMRTNWGTVTLRFTGADSARVDWASNLNGYSSGGLDLQRLTRLTGQVCD